MRTRPRNRLLAGVLVASLLALPATVHAQIPVTDVAALAQWIDTVKTAKDTWEIFTETVEILRRLGRGMGGRLVVFRVPSLPGITHDVTKYLYGGDLLEGFNTGDARGDRYRATVLPLMLPGDAYDQLPPELQRIFKAHYAGIETNDAVLQLGIHETALAREYAGRLEEQIQLLEDDVTNPAEEYHELTTIADKIAVAKLLETRQDQNSNQLLSSILEQHLADAKDEREGDVAHAHLVINALLDDGEGLRNVVGNGAALANWGAAWGVR